MLCKMTATESAFAKWQPENIAFESGDNLWNVEREVEVASQKLCIICSAPSDLWTCGLRRKLKLTFLLAKVIPLNKCDLEARLFNAPYCASCQASLKLMHVTLSKIQELGREFKSLEKEILAKICYQASDLKFGAFQDDSVESLRKDVQGVLKNGHRMKKRKSVLNDNLILKPVQVVVQKVQPPESGVKTELNHVSDEMNIVADGNSLKNCADTNDLSDVNDVADVEKLTDINDVAYVNDAVQAVEMKETIDVNHHSATADIHRQTVDVENVFDQDEKDFDFEFPFSGDYDSDFSEESDVDKCSERPSVKGSKRLKHRLTRKIIYNSKRKYSKRNKDHNSKSITKIPTSSSQIIVCPYDGCGRKFSWKSACDGHYYRDHFKYTKPFGCEFCDRWFKDSRGLSKHRWVHKFQNAVCDQCGKTYKSSHVLKYHIRNMHQGERQKFKCPDCPNEYSGKQGLEAHRIRKHTKKFPFNCKSCNMGFAEKCSYKNHLDSHRPGFLTCNVCNRTFANKYNLAFHMKLHSGDPREEYECDICGRKLKTKSGLRKHRDTHGEKVFECKECNKKFSSKRNLTLHEMFHSKDRPHICEVCGKGYLTRAILTQHSLIHSGVRRYECKICHKRFIQSGTLINHYRSHRKAQDKNKQFVPKPNHSKRTTLFPAPTASTDSPSAAICSSNDNDSTCSKSQISQNSNQNGDSSQNTTYSDSLPPSQPTAQAPLIPQVSQVMNSNFGFFHQTNTVNMYPVDFTSYTYNNIYERGQL